MVVIRRRMGGGGGGDGSHRSAKAWKAQQCEVLAACCWLLTAVSFGFLETSIQLLQSVEGEGL